METENVKGYEGVFHKADGAERSMRFVRMQDMPVERIPPRKRQDAKARVLKEGQELVWDVGAGGYRTYNWTTSTACREVEVGAGELPPVQATT